MAIRTFHAYRRNLRTAWLVIAIACALPGSLLFPSPGLAGLILDAELRLSYEDNVVGLLSDQQGAQAGGGMYGRTMAAAGGMVASGGSRSRYPGSSSTTSQSRGDFSATAFAAAGGFLDVFDASTIFAKGFAEHTSYGAYRELDADIGGVGVGISSSLGRRVSSRIALTGRIKRFSDSRRNSGSYGGGVSMKETLAEDLWLRQFGEYERNDADSSLFSYRGVKVGVSMSYAFTGKTTASIGYSYLVQEYEEPSGAELRTGTAFASAEYDFSRSWSAAAEYDRQISRDTVTGSNATNNIYSLALRFGF